MTDTSIEVFEIQPIATDESEFLFMGGGVFEPDKKTGPGEDLPAGQVQLPAKLPQQGLVAFRQKLDPALQEFERHRSRAP